MTGRPEDYEWLSPEERGRYQRVDATDGPDAYSNHPEDDEQGQAEDLDDVTNGEVETTEEPTNITQRISLAGGGRSVELQLEDIEAMQAMAYAMEMWRQMGPQPHVPVGFAAEALHTERSAQDE